MAPPSQLIQYPHLLSILLLLVAAVASEHLKLQQATAASDEPQDQAQQQGMMMMGRPGCRDKCGGMIIPFPFGMDRPDCFLPGYQVTCNTSFTPPRAFLAYSGGSAQGPPYKVIYQNTFGTETATDSPEYRYPEFHDLYPCDGICTNIPGGYDCRCKRGMKGDAKKGNCTEIFPLPAKIIVGISGLIVVVIIMVMAKQHLKLKRFYEQNGGPILNGVKNIRIYTKKQLKQITNNYENVIGQGHFGKVYKGTLKDNQQVAVKKSIKVDKDMKKEFTDEVIIQSEMRHKNIVRLLGCCLEFDVPMLVYEFVEKGSLYDVLFKSKDSIPVNKRLAIAIGSAEGLTYMHSAGESTIRHGDVKSANILLDEHFTPKVSDFGTSKLLAKGKDEETDRVIGDMSYIDPIYMEKGIVTQKSDVYSFGVVLIELITRRPATYDVKRSYVTNFVQSCAEKGARNFIDNDVTSEVDINILEMVSGVVVDCLKSNPEERQDMKQVEHRLLEIVGQPIYHGQKRNSQ